MGISRSNVMAFRLALFVTLVAITYLALAPVPYALAENVNDKLEHALAFLVLALFVDFSFPENGFGLRKILALLGYGLLIEVVQYFIPYRTFSLYDVAADGLGLALYGCSIPALRRLPWFRFRWHAPPG